jgi:lipopolysaccharide/colanic/teichoic acid biosynthesis glycosyltransferase
MSLVGPRPDVLPVESYQPWQAKRFEVLPGMTGYWQVNGKNTTTPQQMMEMDVYYVENRSLGLDLKILSRTAAAILRKMPEDD